MEKFENLRTMLEKTFKLQSSQTGFEVNEVQGTGITQISAFREQKDVKLNKRSTSVSTFIYDGKNLINTNQFSYRDASVNINKPYKNGERRAIVKTIEKDCFLEIFDKNMLMKTIKLDAIGKVCTSGTIVKESIQWSKDGNRLMFLANRKEKKYDYFNEKSEEAFEALDSFKYKHNYGEANFTYHTDMELNIVEISEKNGSLDAELNKVNFDSEGLAISKFDFLDAQGKSITFSAYELGENEYLISPYFCSNKKSGVYIQKDCCLTTYAKPDTTDQKEKTEEKLETLQKPHKISESPIAFTPIVSLDGQQIAYFYNDEVLNLHCYEVGLKVYNVETASTQTVISTKEKENQDDMVIWNYPIHFNKATWVDDTNVVFNNAQDAVNSVCMVDTKEKRLYNLDYNRDFNFEVTTFQQQIRDDEWLVNLNSRGYASRLAVLKNAKESIKKKYARTVEMHDKTPLIKENIDQKRKECPQVFVDPENLVSEEYYVDGIRMFLWYLKDNLLPEGMPAIERPLLVFLHGGPNGYTTGDFHPALNVLLHKGFQVLSVNFSGSSSFDTNFVRALATKSGIQDVLETQNVINVLITAGILNKTKMYFLGGSYSGQIGLEFAAKFPGYFQKYVLRNPVTNYLHQTYNTDLSDWNIAQIEPWDHEAFDIGKDFTLEQLEKMVKHSPGLKEFDVEKLKDSKIVFHIGTADLRVPPDAQIYTYKKLKKLGINVELKCYPKDNHGITTEVKHMFDSSMSIIMEFVE